MNKLISSILLIISISYAQYNISVYGGINYGLHKGIRDYINQFNFDNNKFMSSVTVILEKSINLSENYYVGLEGYINYLSITKSNLFISNFQLDITTLGINLILKKQFENNFFIGGGFGYNHNMVEQTYLSFTLNNKKGSFGLLLLTELVAISDEENIFSLVISPRIRINLPGNLIINKDSFNLTNNKTINLNSLTTELNIGINF